MTTEEAIAKVIDVLKNSDSLPTEKDIMNKANEVLYPLKESKQIAHYYFSIKKEVNHHILSIFIQETEETQTECWDLSVSPSS